MEKAAPRGVALGGFMATGKSTVGPLLAQRLRLPFWDLDLEVETSAGMSIAQVFQTQGESTFRKMERDSLTELVTRAPCVLASAGAPACRFEYCGAGWISSGGAKSGVGSH